MTVLKLRRSHNCWVLIAPKGHTLHELDVRTTTRDAAYAEAVAWASSWSGIMVEFEDEQDKKRD